MSCGTEANPYHTLDALRLILPSGTLVDTSTVDADVRLAHDEPALHSGLLRLRNTVRADVKMRSEIKRLFAIKNTMGYRLCAFLDADTVLGTDSVEELASALRDGPERALHGAALPRFDTWVSRYWELNRMLVKELRFDGQLSGELIALRRATLAAHDLAALFPEAIGAKDDLYLGRALAARGCAIGYLPTARATTLVPWTLAGLAATMLRSRRGAMGLLPLRTASLQAAVSAVLVGSVPAALIASHWSLILAAVCCILPIPA